MTKFLKMLPLFLLLCACGASPGTGPGGLVRGIVGGKNVSSRSVLGLGQVFIVLENAKGIPETCTGSFISRKHILTAAHCVSPDLDGMFLMGGLSPIRKERESFTIARIFVHPLYKARSKERHDLALIEIKEDFSHPEAILNLPEAQTSPAQELLAMGYGRTNGREDDSANLDKVGYLRQVKLNSLSLDGNKITVDQSSGKGVCFGDSGGPLVAAGKINYILGVASGVKDDAGLASDAAPDLCLKKSVFISVKSYTDWIKAIIQ